MAFAVKDDDASVKITRALPNGAQTVASTGIDLGHGTLGDFLANCELQIEAPAVSTTELPDGQTFTYDLFHDTASDFSGEVLLADNVVTQTGAGAAGAAAQTVQYRPAVDVKRYVRLKITGSATAGNASGKNATFRLVF